MMMRIDHKRLNEVGGVWVTQDGEVVDTARAEAVSDSIMARRQAQANAKSRYLAAAQAGKAHWVVLVTANRAEKDVHNWLVDLGMEAWLPLKKVETTRRIGRLGRAKTAEMMPAFAGYVFVRCRLCAESWALLMSGEGVAGVLGADGVPFPVADKIINKLKLFVDEGGLDQKRAKSAYTAGDKVAIRSGPFAWFEGEFQGYAGSLHVRVLTSIFGRSTPVTLELDQIAKAD